ncbi:MAG: hypothetical protein K5821_13410 [Nitrobacter sp.]|uniref:hypothetical protein n=1 Tax=Nitrobacter sp. TaxID=29420 RepID=UPI0026143440|nr:hypothetical protein [Nitrobacter sp.]MCV0387401.1 hypothetical protein [Nitrobacter sp.]
MIVVRKQPTQARVDLFSEKGEFARAVRELYFVAIAKSTKDRPAGAGELEVRQVAFGLAAIHQLIQREIDRIKSAPLSDEFTATGLSDAAQLLEGLITGYEHPIHRYVTDLHTADYRSNRPAPNAVDMLGRGIVVGAVRALGSYAGLSSEAEARRQVSPALSGNRPLTPDMVKRWNRTFSETKDPLPDAARRDLEKRADALPNNLSPVERVLLAAKDMLARFWVTPKLPPA